MDIQHIRHMKDLNLNELIYDKINNAILSGYQSDSGPTENIFDPKNIFDPDNNHRLINRDSPTLNLTTFLLEVIEPQSIINMLYDLRRHETPKVCCCIGNGIVDMIVNHKNGVLVSEIIIGQNVREIQSDNCLDFNDIRVFDRIRRDEHIDVVGGLDEYRPIVRREYDLGVRFVDAPVDENDNNENDDVNDDVNIVDRIRYVPRVIPVEIQEEDGNEFVHDNNELAYISNDYVEPLIDGNVYPPCTYHNQKENKNEIKKDNEYKYEIDMMRQCDTLDSIYYPDLNIIKRIQILYNCNTEIYDETEFEIRKYKFTYGDLNRDQNHAANCPKFIEEQRLKEKSIEEHTLKDEIMDVILLSNHSIPLMYSFVRTIKLHITTTQKIDFNKFKVINGMLNTKERQLLMNVPFELDLQKGRIINFNKCGHDYDKYYQKYKRGHMTKEELEIVNGVHEESLRRKNIV